MKNKLSIVFVIVAFCFQIAFCFVLIKKEFSTDVIGPSKYNFYEYLLAKFDKY